MEKAKSDMELLDLGLQKVKKGESSDEESETPDWISEKSEDTEVWSKIYTSNYLGYIEPSDDQYLYVLTYFPQAHATPIIKEARVHSSLNAAKNNLDRLAYLAARSAVTKILAAASDPLEPKTFLNAWIGSLDKAKPDTEGFELELDSLSGDFEEMADLLGIELPYSYSFDHGSWMQKQQKGPTTESVPIALTDIISETEDAIRSRLAVLKKDLFEQYNLSPEIEIEGRGTQDDPFYLVLRYTEEDAALLQNERGAV